MDVNLACVRLSVSDLLRCSFGLSKLEVSALLGLLEAGQWTTVAVLASRLERHRSVVQRGVSSLMAKGLVLRDQKNKPGGGYEYLYQAKDKRLIKDTIVKNSRTFCRMVQDVASTW